MSVPGAQRRTAWGRVPAIDPRLAWVGGALGLVLAGLPLLVAPSLRTGSGLLLALLLAALVSLAVAADYGRTVLALALTGWAAAGIALGTGEVAVAAVCCGVLLRVWAGLPELTQLGRPALADLGVELLGGAAAAGVVVVAARRVEELPAVGLLLALSAAGLLVLAAARRLRP